MRLLVFVIKLGIIQFIQLFLRKCMDVNQERWNHSSNRVQNARREKNKGRLIRAKEESRRNKRKYLIYSILWWLWVVVSPITFFATTAAGSDMGVEIIAEITGNEGYEKDPAMYESVSADDAIAIYESQKERGLFWDIKEGSSISEISSDTIKGYREQVNREIGSLQAGMDVSLILDDGITADYDRLKELDIEIKSYTDRTKVPIEIYKEEFEIRRHACSENYSAENAYQTARAADDVFHILFLNYKQGGRKNDMEKSELEDIFYYASFANIYYNETLKWSDTEESRNDILFKMGLIFQKLYLLSDMLDGESEQSLEEKDTSKIHFLLMANAFFEMCRYYDGKDNLCYELFDYYFGCNLYESGYFAELSYQRELWTDAVIYLQQYIDKQTSMPQEKQDVNLIFDSEYRIGVINPRIGEP